MRRRHFVCLCAHYEMLVSMHWCVRNLAETANILVYRDIFTNENYYAPFTLPKTLAAILGLVLILQIFGPRFALAQK